MKGIRKPVFARCIALLFLVSFTSCNSCQFTKNLSKAVVIKYDQRFNFFEYEFDSPVGDSPTSPKFTGATVQTPGVWIVYTVCSVENKGSKAVPFILDRHKFYVLYENNKKSFSGFPDGSYVLVPYLFGYDSPAVTERLEIDFHGGGYTNVSVQPNQTLPVMVRVLVRMPLGAENIPQAAAKTLSVPLLYNETPVLMVNRGYQTGYYEFDEKVHSKDLPGC